MFGLQNRYMNRMTTPYIYIYLILYKNKYASVWKNNYSFKKFHNCYYYNLILVSIKSIIFNFFKFNLHGLLVIIHKINITLIVWLIFIKFENFWKKYF